jgi:hypothetical protein
MKPDHHYDRRGGMSRRDDSFDEGYDCGYEDGYRAAMKEAKHYYGERRSDERRY